MTHTVGSDSPPDLGRELLFYDAPDQILLEKVGQTPYHLEEPPGTPLFAHGPLQLEFPFNLFQIPALATIKLSILFLYRRIFRGQAFNIASWVLIGIVIAWAITFFVALLAACGTPFAANFQMLAVLKRECVDTFRILIAFAVSDVAVDVAILIMPIPLVNHFQWLYDSGGLD